MDALVQLIAPEHHTKQGQRGSPQGCTSAVVMHGHTYLCLLPLTGHLPRIQVWAGWPLAQDTPHTCHRPADRQPGNRCWCPHQKGWVDLALSEATTTL